MKRTRLAVTKKHWQRRTALLKQKRAKSEQVRALLLFLATTQAWSATRLAPPTKLVQGRAAARALQSSDEAAAVEEVPRGGFKSWFISNRTPLLFGALVSQKVLADVVTDYTRRQGAYSGATVSMLSEVAKFPVLVAAICAFAGGPSRLWPTVKRAYSDTPFKIAWIAGAYAAQNVLYFAALGRISAASYQVLSQSKMIFTAILAVTMLKEKLRKRDIAALVCLLGGSTLVQLSEMAGAGAGKGGAEALLGRLRRARRFAVGGAQRLVREAPQDAGRGRVGAQRAGHRLDLLVDRAVAALDGGRRRARGVGGRRRPVRVAAELRAGAVRVLRGADAGGLARRRAQVAQRHSDSRDAEIRGQPRLPLRQADVHRHDGARVGGLLVDGAAGILLRGRGARDLVDGQLHSRERPPASSTLVPPARPASSVTTACPVLVGRAASALIGMIGRGRRSRPGRHDQRSGVEDPQGKNKCVRAGRSVDGRHNAEVHHPLVIPGPRRSPPRVEARNSAAIEIGGPRTEACEKIVQRLPVKVPIPRIAMRCR